MSATTFLRRRNYAGDTCKNEEFPAATFGKAFCNFRYLGVAKNNSLPDPDHYLLMKRIKQLYVEFYKPKNIVKFRNTKISIERKAVA